MIRQARPPTPKDFDDQVKDARNVVRAAVARDGKIESKKFNSYWWTKFKGDFEGTCGAKCGFCEGTPTAYASLQVEHYRPKSGIAAILPASPPAKIIRPRDRGHLTSVSEVGYWWLAYLWNNWLLACPICNGDYKGNLFPLSKAHVLPIAEGCESAEESLLLNPFDADDPLDHLDFSDDGLIAARNGSARGVATILTCGLDRFELMSARMTHALRVKELLDA
ncbi:MAG: hypothetical protein U0325_35985 [Polyangiales bacterium]